MQLARQNPTLTVVGIGAQDDLAQAQAFVESTDTGGGELTMLYDHEFASWPAFGVRAQPYWILYNAAGIEVASRGGAVDPGVVIATVEG